MLGYEILDHIYDCNKSFGFTIVNLLKLSFHYHLSFYEQYVLTNKHLKRLSLRFNFHYYYVFFYSLFLF